MFRFAHPENLYYLLLLPALIILYVLVSYLKKKALTKFGDRKIIADLMPETSFTRPLLKFILVLLALSMIIFALAEPQLGSKLEKVKREGVEIIVALDVSNSMMAEDIKPNRLENSRRSILKLIDQLKDDKIGLIIFAGDAYVQLPLTTDIAAAKMFLSAVNTNVVTKQGTAMGSAISLAMKSFSPNIDVSKVLVIITDGENHEDDAMDAAKKAVEKGIVIHTIGMGSPEGSPIPVVENRSDFKKDNGGSIIVTKLEEKLLREIATAGNGIYVRANNTKSALSAILDEIKKMNKKELETRSYSEYEDRFQYLVAIALLLFIIDFLILDRKNRRLKNINLFKKTLIT